MVKCECCEDKATTIFKILSPPEKATRRYDVCFKCYLDLRFEIRGLPDEIPDTNNIDNSLDIC